MRRENIPWQRLVPHGDRIDPPVGEKMKGLGRRKEEGGRRRKQGGGRKKEGGGRGEEGSHFNVSAFLS
jgi:hypothetical protein